MKTMLIELDDRCARDLERVAPTKDRKRARFVRHAIRHAIDLALDRDTARAYEAQPLSAEVDAADLDGWDEHNALAVRRPNTRKTRTAASTARARARDRKRAA